jgi:hypothetical protein
MGLATTQPILRLALFSSPRFSDTRPTRSVRLRTGEFDNLSKAHFENAIKPLTRLLRSTRLTVKILARADEVIE